MFPEGPAPPTYPTRKILLTPGVHLALTLISFLCGVHSLASALEIYPMCSNWDEVTTMTEKVPFISDDLYMSRTTTTPGFLLAVLLDTLIWLFAIFWVFVLRATFIWPFITFGFFVVSQRVRIHWAPKDWATT